MYACMNVWMYGCMDVWNVWMYGCMHVCMHVCMYLSMYLSMYLCIYVSTYVFTYHLSSRSFHMQQNTNMNSYIHINPYIYIYIRVCVCHHLIWSLPEWRKSILNWTIPQEDCEALYGSLYYMVFVLCCSSSICSRLQTWVSLCREIKKSMNCLESWVPAVKLGTRPLEGRGVFVIDGMSWMTFDVVVPIGFCLMWFWRPEPLILVHKIKNKHFA